MAGLEAVHETVIVAGGFEGFGGAFAGHDPVVVGVFSVVFAEVVFGDVMENAERFFGRVGDQFHAGMIFPGAEREFGFFGRVVVLLIDEGAGVADETAEPIGAEPPHGERGGAAGAATHDGVAPGIVGESDVRVGGFDFGIGKDRRNDFIVNEAGEAIAHGVVFEAAFTVFAVVAAVLDGDGDEGGKFAVGVV